MRDFNADGSENNPGRDDWMAGFDDSSSSGLVCLTCHALVPRMASHTAGHRKWHEAADER